MTSPIILETKNLDLFYGKFQALKKVNMSIEPHRITSIIGPSGCGKSTLLRAMNRMNDWVEGCRVEGQIILEGQDIYSGSTDLLALRKKVGMVFQRPNPFPLSILENVLFGLKIHRLYQKQKNQLNEIVEKSLKEVLLWDELKDKLQKNATSLSLEQQQRLCIARLLVVKPEILLMDEPCSALDPIATARVEELMMELKRDYTIVIVTHNMQQAARVSDRTGYMLLGELVEYGETEKIFTTPVDRRTEDYITGRMG